MDGVLFDSIGFAKESFLKGHPGMTDEMYREMGMGNFYEEMEKYAHLKTPETEEEAAKRKAVYAETKSRTPMFDGTKELLISLHGSGYVLVLNTNAYERNCLPLLERSGIMPLFSLIAAAELSKSKVEKFRLIDEKYGFSKEDTLFITDSLGDVREADEAGIPTVAVTWGIHDESYFNREPHANLIGIADSVVRLKDFISAIGPLKSLGNDYDH